MQLTPPRPSDPSATMSTLEWLQQPELRPRLKRQSNITFDDKNERQKKLKYEPREEATDVDILGYHSRAEPSHQDRDKICVTFPCSDLLEEAKESRAQMQNEILVCMISLIFPSMFAHG